MNQYESVVIINPNVEDAGVKELIQKFSNLINNDGKVEKVEELGKKKLAYEIRHMKEGFYYFIQFDAEPEVPGKIEQVVRIMDNVLRYLCVRQEA